MRLIGHAILARSVAGRRSRGEARSEAEEIAQVIDCAGDGEWADRSSLIQAIATHCAAYRTLARREAIRRLLLYVYSEAPDLLESHSRVAPLPEGMRPRSGYLAPLFRMAVHEHLWVRKPESWQSNGKGRQEKFSDLARHLAH